MNKTQFPSRMPGSTLWVCLLCSGSALAQSFVDHPFNSDGLYASQNDVEVDGYGNFATVYDNFAIAGGGAIKNVGWLGGYLNPGPPGSIARWTVSVYADAAGTPGSPLLTATVPGDGNESATGQFAADLPVFEYSIQLPAAFVASPGQQYWLSVVPDQTYPPQWGWATGSGGDASSVQDYLGDRGTNGSDLAFTLAGVVVPEPSEYAALTGAAILGFALYRRSKTGGKA